MEKNIYRYIYKYTDCNTSIYSIYRICMYIYIYPCVGYDSQIASIIIHKHPFNPRKTWVLPFSSPVFSKKKWSVHPCLLRNPGRCNISQFSQGLPRWEVVGKWGRSSHLPPYGLNLGKFGKSSTQNGYFQGIC